MATAKHPRLNPASHNDIHRAREMSLGLGPLGHTPLHPDDAKRSAHNISEWNTYLPTECVRTMVRMGWDYTT